MPTHRILLTTAAAAALLLCAAPAEADTAFARTTRPPDLSAGEGLVVYSAYDAGSERYRLMQIEDGAVSAVPVAPSPSPFEPDVGRTSSGHAFLVYVRCEKASGERRGCDLYAFNPATGEEQRSKASDPRHDEATPTYWRGRLAFTREYGGDTGDVVYQRPTARTRRSQRLAGAVRKSCRGKTCAGPGRVLGLELYGEHLAESLYDERLEPLGRGEVYASGSADLRLVDAATGSSQLIAMRGSGESGQSWLTPSFDRGRLHAYFQCDGDPSGCSTKNAGYYRYDLGDRDWAMSGAGSNLSGFGVTRGATYRAVEGTASCSFPEPKDVADGCTIERVEPAPSYRAIDEP